MSSSEPANSFKEEASTLSHSLSKHNRNGGLALYCSDSDGVNRGSTQSSQLPFVLHLCNELAMYLVGIGSDFSYLFLQLDYKQKYFPPCSSASKAI